MRLLFIIPRNPIPARDGGALGMVGSFKGLHEAGHELDLLVLNTRRHASISIQPSRPLVHSEM
jgi:hypothetical protein